MKKSGILRLFTIFLICLTIIFYNFNVVIKEEKNEKKIFSSANYFWEDEGIIEEKSEENSFSIEETNNNIKTEEKEEIKEVSAEAVKGKIISKYISPYTAPLSYGGVYLKNNTQHNIDIKKLLEEKLSFKIEKSEKPQVLILHTHATETFMESDKEYYTDQFNSRTKNNDKNMVKIGSVIADKLNSAGIVTLHSTTQHDSPQYTGSYSRSAKTVNEYLKKYPSIKIIFDLHRDAVSSGESDKVKLVTEINGKKAAQVMLVMGSQSETVKNYPNWRENLKLAVKIHQKIEEKYPTLARPILFMPKSYNQGLSTGSVLIEFGTDANTLDEAVYSAELVSDALISLFETLKE